MRIGQRRRHKEEQLSRGQNGVTERNESSVEEELHAGRTRNNSLEGAKILCMTVEEQEESVM